MRLSVENLSFRYNGRPVLEDISFQLRPGSILALLGVNGAGKSTLLKCLNKILKPQKGIVVVEGKNLARMPGTSVAKNIGYVPQRSDPDSLTVFDTVLLGRKPYITWSVGRKDIAVVENILEIMKLHENALRPVSTLSGGELQKVMIARALAQEPKILLLDEPTSSLDMRNQLEIMQLVSEIVAEHNISVVMVCHDLNLALRYGDTFMFLKDGGMRAIGDKEILTSELIKEVFGIHCVVSSVEGYPVVVPVHCCHNHSH